MTELQEEKLIKEIEEKYKTFGEIGFRPKIESIMRSIKQQHKEPGYRILSIVYTIIVNKNSIPYGYRLLIDRGKGKFKFELKVEEKQDD
jgi:hypothetical protein